MQIELKRLVNPTAIHLSLYIVLGIIIWATTYVGAVYTRGISIDELVVKLHDPELLWKNVISFALTLVNSIFLSQLINRFSFVNARTFLPVFVFALLIIVWEPAHLMYESHAALFLFICALFQFFDMSQEEASEKAFLGSFFIACGSLFMNDLIFILPACWLGFIALQTFSFRVFLASVLGTLTPWLIYISIIYATSPVFNFHDLFSVDFSLGFSMEELQIPTKIYIGILFVMFFISLVGTYTEFYKHANNTRRNINFTLLLLIYFIILFILQKNFEGTFFPFIALCFAVFISNVFSTKRNNFYSILLLVFLFVNIVFVIYNFLF